MKDFEQQAKEIVGKWGYEEAYWWKPIAEALRATHQEAQDEMYNAPCPGCPEGHPSFYKTIVESKEWQAWEKVANEQGFDYDESRECGYFSTKHWQAFLKFQINLTLSSLEKELPKENVIIESDFENGYETAIQDIRSIIQSHKV